MVDTDAEVFEEDIEDTVIRHIVGKTIVVDPMNFLLRNLGSRNNTIIHECVHWVKHRKYLNWKDSLILLQHVLVARL